MLLIIWVEFDVDTCMLVRDLLLFCILEPDTCSILNNRQSSSSRGHFVGKWHYENISVKLFLNLDPLFGTRCRLKILRALDRLCKFDRGQHFCEIIYCLVGQ